MWVFIIFSCCLLLFGSHKFQHYLLLTSIILYQLVFIVLFPSVITVEVYMYGTGIITITFAFCIYDWDKWKLGRGFDWLWVIEMLPLIMFRMVETLFLINPEKYYLERIGFNNYLMIDYYSIGGILFILFCREVGYNPFTYKFENLRKYTLAILVSYIFFVNYI